jgi:hypothetical protein
MALSFFVQELSWTTMAVRVGWSFVIAYGLTFLLVNIIVHTRMAEADRIKTHAAAEAQAIVNAARDETVDPGGEDNDGTPIS